MSNDLDSLYEEATRCLDGERRSFSWLLLSHAKLQMASCQPGLDQLQLVKAWAGRAMCLVKLGDISTRIQDRQACNEQALCELRVAADMIGCIPDTTEKYAVDERLRRLAELLGVESLR